MNPSETNLSGAPNAGELKEQLAWLHFQTTALLLALIVLGGTLCVFIWRQASVARKDLAAMKPQATQIIETYTKNRQAMEQFLKQIAEYGRTHSDFVPILNKYRIAVATAAPPPAPAPKK